MNKYHFDLVVQNDHGELLDVRRSFSSLDELNNFMTDSTKMHELWCEAEKNGKEDGILYEELFDSKEDMELAMDNGLTADDLVNSN